MGNEIIELNVGGFHYTTTKSTLSCLQAEESFLSKLCDGNFGNTVDRSGRLFIDRDGEHFGYILNFLRNSELIVEPSSTVCKLLLKEANFYGIPALEEQLEQVLAHLEKQEKEARKSSEPVLSDSVLRQLVSLGASTKPEQGSSQRRRRSISSPTSMELKNIVSAISLEPEVFTSDIDF